MDERILLRVPEAAERLGISRAYAFRLIAAGQIPIVRIGSAVRVPAAALREWAEKKAEPWSNGAA